MRKSLCELFSKYTPEGELLEFMSSVDGDKYEVSCSTSDDTSYEIVLQLNAPVHKHLLYEIEKGIRNAYHNKYSIKIKTKYPPECFGYDYVEQLFLESEHIGGVTKGFFKDCEYELNGNRLNIAIPFGQGALLFLETGKTETLLASIIKYEFGISVEVEITEMDEYKSYYESDDYKREMAEIDSSCEAALLDYDRHIREESNNDGDSDRIRDRDKANGEATNLNLTRIWSPFNPDEIAITEDGVCNIGKFFYDVSAPTLIWGEKFDVKPESISMIRTAKRNTIIIGKLTNVTCEARFKPKWSVSMGVCDGNATMLVRFQQCDEQEAIKLSDTFKAGMYVAVRGDVLKEKKSEDLYLTPNGIQTVDYEERKDKGKEKRIELHLHTTMSAMDALISPDDAIKTAYRWGHKAVAVTDHGNVQGFPDAMLAREKIMKGKHKDDDPKSDAYIYDDSFKVIYGIEAYLVNDKASPLNGMSNGDITASAVIFDLETTGLSAINNQIIEIGAVKIKDGEITERYSTFVNPGCPIPAKTTEITSITDEDVADAPTIDEALPAFLEFVGDTLMIAHNADFDIGFIRAAATHLGIGFNNPYLDTVALSRFINNDLKSHTLDAIAKYYALGDFNHHRAVDDAEMLAAIYLCMAEKLRKFEINDFAAMNREIRATANPMKLHTTHAIILVRNSTGMKNLYRLVSESYLKYYYKTPRIPKTELDKYREGLIVGSACSEGELYRAILENKSDAELQDIASYYDYLEVQPAGNNMYLIEKNSFSGVEALWDINRRICKLGEICQRPVVATSDAHFLNPEDELGRRVLQAGKKFNDADASSPIYFHTTDEMLDEFSYLGEDKAYDVVVRNTNAIADMIDVVRPIPTGTFTPHLDGAEEELTEKCWSRARAMYGDDPPLVVKNRLEVELKSIISNGFAVLYVIAERLVKFSESQGYLVGSRGSVGSSFVATMSGISEVNPLPPHYYCKKCRYSDFSNKTGAGSGFDMPAAVCPVCGEQLEQDGQDIPFETFLGFKGDKSPDIDLNFSGEVQGRVHKFTEELFGAENVFRAGTLGTLADKTAFGFVMKYYESRGQMPCRAEVERIMSMCVGVKRTTGQHPGGIIVVPRDRDVYDFTPIQHPADDPSSTIVTTHFAFSYLHDTILKLDELGHDIPTKYKMLEKYSGISVMDVAMNDHSVYELFASTEPLGIPQQDRESKRTKMLGLTVGTLGLPEMGTNFIQGVLVDSRPKNFADLMQISGLTHGTDVWLGNAQMLIKNGTCDISQVVGTRDGIMLDLIRYGVDKSLSFKIMEFVRKNKKGIIIPSEMLEAMKEKNVPEWYVESLQKIKYMFPKAHAAAYVMSAIRLGWYKVHRPVAFYCAILSVAPDGFDADIVSRGKEFVEKTMINIDKLGKDATQKEKETFSALQMAYECMLRGIRFLPVSLRNSDATEFLPEDGNIRMPLTALSGLGINAAKSIVDARNTEQFYSVEDLRERAKINKSVIETLRQSGVLDGMSETEQLSMFD